MDSMDWFQPASPQIPSQIKALHRALKPGGKVLLRSAGLTPHYIAAFQAEGFSPRRVGARLPGKCIDRYVPSRSFLASVEMANPLPSASRQSQHVRLHLDLHQERRPQPHQLERIRRVRVLAREPRALIDGPYVRTYCFRAMMGFEFLARFCNGDFRVFFFFCGMA